MADIAMYHAKRPGNGKLLAYNPSMRSDGLAVVSSRIANAVYEALDTGKGLRLHYQPIHHVTQDKDLYYEALMRIEDSQGLLNPAEILPIVANQHLEDKLDQRIIQTILDDLSKQRIPAGRGISINLAAPTLVNPSIIDHLQPFRDYMDNYSFILEVTETALITQIDEASKILATLRSQNFKIALDDFGSGYSSLRYLNKMPVDIIKLDQSIIETLCTGNEDADLMASLINMIRMLPYKLVAEGVENEDMLEVVKENGIPLVQGFLTGRPRVM